MFNSYSDLGSKASYNASKISYDLLDLRTASLFLKILSNNLLVAFLLSVIGYFTGGILTIIISFYNGFKLALIIGSALPKLSISHVLIGVFHVPLEIVALSWFGGLGLLGFSNLVTIMAEDHVTLSSFPNYKFFKTPVTILCIAAIIETSLFVVF